MHHQGKGDGNHGQIGPFDPQRRDRQQRTERTADQRGGDHRQTERAACHGQQGADVGADRIEGDMAKGNLATQADQDVQPGADHHGQGEEAEHQQGIAVEGKRQRHAAQGQCGGSQQVRQRHLVDHTFTSVLLPNRPSGRSASARMTSAKVNIWVKAEPK